MENKTLTADLLAMRGEKLAKRRAFFKNVGGISVGMVAGSILTACGGSVSDAVAQMATPTDTDILKSA
jgi:hypothetical protein